MRPCEVSRGDPLAAFDAWYRTLLGRRVAAAEAVCLERFLEDSFGYYLLQLGAPEPFAAALVSSRIRQRIVIDRGGGMSAPRCPPAVVALRANVTQLPVASDSLDAIVLPHTLDFIPDPHRVLREVERVLIPEGRLVLFGFNPLSTWGLRRAWPCRSPRVPWCGSMLTPFRICDWLTLIGFQIDAREMLVFRPPMRRLLIAQFDWIDALGQKYWPMFGGVYAVRAVKRVSTLRSVPLGRKHRRPVLTGRAVETARKSSHV